MTRNILTIFILAFAISLVGCGGGGESGETEAAVSPEQGQKVGSFAKNKAARSTGSTDNEEDSTEASQQVFGPELNEVLIELTNDLVREQLGDTTIEMTASINDQLTAEGSDSFPTLTLRRTEAGIDQPVGLTIKLDGKGNKDDLVDFEPQLIFPAGETELDIPLMISDDELVEATEAISINIVEPDFVQLTIESTLGIIIQDNDTDTAEIQLGEQSTTTIFQTDSPIEAVGGSESNPNTVGQAIGDQPGLVFDGEDDVASIPNGDEINTSPYYEAKTVIAVFRTSSDIHKRQVIYEQGGSARGLNIYLDEGHLYMNAYNLPNDDNGTTTPWSPKFVSSSVRPNTTYVALLEMDSLRGTISGRINNLEVGSMTGVGRLYGHAGKLGLGAVNNDTVFHDGSIFRSGYNFQGAIGDIQFYNQVLSVGQKQAVVDGLMRKYGLNDKPLLRYSITTPNLREGVSDQVQISISLSQPLLKDLVVTPSLTGDITKNHLGLPEEITIPAFTTEHLVEARIIDNNEVDTPRMIGYLSINGNDELVVMDTGAIKLSWQDDEGYSPNFNKTSLWAIINGSSWQDISNNEGSIENKGTVTLTESGLSGLSVVENQANINSSGPYINKIFALRFTTGSDVSVPQVIFEQGGTTRGINFTIKDSQLYFVAYNKASDYSNPSWDPVFLSAPIAPHSEYTVIASLTMTGENQPMQLSINGSEMEATYNMYPMGSHAGDISIGGSQDGTVGPHNSNLKGSHFLGTVKEVLLFNDSLSDSERSQLEDYFQ